MGSQFLEIVRQGVWASLTGGWFFDPRQGHAANILHLYLWLFLLALPFCLYMFADTVRIMWTIYITLVTILFTSLKILNIRLHRLFDTGEAVQESATREEQTNGERVELQLLPPRPDGETPPVQCSSRNSLSLANRVDSIEFISHRDTNSVDLAVQLARRSSAASSVGSRRSVGTKRSVGGTQSVRSALSPESQRKVLQQETASASGVTTSLTDETSHGTHSGDTALSSSTSLQQPPASVNCPVGPFSSFSQTTSADPLMKITGSVELGFISQDPSVARARTQTGGNSPRGLCEGRQPVRRAHSEMETSSQKEGDKKNSSGIPPSHPVSLEAISSQPPPPGAVPRRSMDHIRKGLSEVTIQEDDAVSAIATTPSHKDHTILTNETCSDHQQRKKRHRRKKKSSAGSGAEEATTTDDSSTDTHSERSSTNFSVIFNPKEGNERKILASTTAPNFGGKKTQHVDSLATATTSEGKPAKDQGSFEWSFTPNEEDARSSSSASSPDETTPSLKPNEMSRQSCQDSKELPAMTAWQRDQILRLWEILNKKDDDVSSRDVRKLKEALLVFGTFENYEEKEAGGSRASPVSGPSGKDSGKELRSRKSSGTGAAAAAAPAAAAAAPAAAAATAKSELDQSSFAPDVVACATAALNANITSSSILSDGEDNFSPPSYLLASMLSTPGTHLARSHEDTSPGAVHCFRDEEGNWQAYTFNESGRPSSPVTYVAYLNSRQSMQTRRPRLKVTDRVVAESEHGPWDAVSQASSSSGATLMVAAACSERPAQSELVDNLTSGHSVTQRSSTTARQDSRLHRPSEEYYALHSQVPRPSTSRFLFGDINPMEIDIRGPSSFVYPMDAREELPRSRQYYLFKLLPWKAVKVAFDRLTLMAVLDRNVTICENVFSVVLAVLVAILGSCCLQRGLFVDLSSFIFCFVIASCQYSLLKSVQPDAASPTHGYNHLVLYSRPVYFCVCCLALLLSQGVLESDINYPEISVYNWKLCTPEGIKSIKNFLVVFVLCFPLLFSFGLLPQVNTFLTYLCEQLDMHIFGGTAATGPLSAVYCLSRSLLVSAILHFICYSALLENRNPANNITFSLFCGILVTSSYHLSRSQSDPIVILQLLRGVLSSSSRNQPQQQQQQQQQPQPQQQQQQQQQPQAQTSMKVDDMPRPLTEEQDRQQWKMQEFIDPLPQKMKDTVLARLKTDAIYVTLLTVFVFAIHVSTMFSVLQPYLQIILHTLAITWGVFLHYFLPQMRKHLPWLCCSMPFLKSREHDVYESTEPAQLMWFERIQVMMWFFEKNCLYPLVILNSLTISLGPLLEQFGLALGCFVLVFCSMRCLRGAFTDPSKHYIALTFTLLVFKYDFKGSYSEPQLVNLFVMLLVTNKVYELLLKLRFVITYIAPWQITWGSAFHAFAQPFSVPHSAMLFIQAIVSSVLSAPLSPVLGSAIFFTSYVRPVKFWERDYNTKRVDHSNTCLSSQLERNPGSDDNNLNSIFYEHLTRSLQKSLYGDLALGRWGAVSQGDCFVLASENLNCLVHIIEYGNGLVTFQLRGLEFRGTYCQQREVEAITEEVKDNLGCCCCEPGHLPGMLSVNAAFNQRWLAWEVSAAKYILEGYSISDNSAVPLLQLFEVRRALMTYYVKSIIFYAITNKKLEEWLENRFIQEALLPTLDKQYAELDPVFTPTNDADFDGRVTGISRNSFCKTYLPWIQYCVGRIGKHLTMINDKNSNLVSLCFALSVLARRALGSASHNTLQSVDYLLFGLHALFKGDIRIASVRDEWVFFDMDLIKKVVAPAVRMAFKLHQDHFMSSDELERSKELFDTIESYTNTLVISHEADPAWRNAVLSGVQSLLALRHVADENSDDYKIITLNKRFLDFRVIKVNRECVRGLWAGQQQELVYLRNRNPERGSIQNAKQALRNIINSSCDQPIGYPIYVSPLTTSFAETSSQLCSLVGGPLSLSVFKQSIFDFWRRLKIRCGEGCSSGGTGFQDDGCGAGYSAPASLSGSIARGVDPSVVAPPRRSHSSGSHLTNTDVATASVGGRTTTSASSSTIGAIGATSSSLGRNSASYVRTSLGNLTVSSLTKPGSANVTVVSMRPFEETPFVIGESAGSRSTVFGTWDPQTGQLVATSSSSAAGQDHTSQSHQSNVITSEMTKL